MDCIITRLFAFGLVPLWFAGLAAAAAESIFMWSSDGAMLWAIAAALSVIGLGLYPCKRFLEAGDHRTKEPHEVGRFMVWLLWLHVLGVLGLVLGYEALAAAFESPSLAPAGAVCWGAVNYWAFTWIFFAGEDPQCIGREMQTWSDD